MRQHFEHLLAASGALIFAVLVSYFNTGTVVHVPVTHSSNTLRPVSSDAVVIATSTFPGLDLASSTLETLFHPHPTATTTPPTPSQQPTTTPRTPTTPPVVVKPKPTPAPQPVTPPAPPVVVATTTASSTPQTTDSDVLSTLKKSIVNIICISKDGSLRSISGSGVIIDSRGIILTVSHVAQSLLLEDYLSSDRVDCVVRTGSPARNAYTAEPIFVPEQWVKDNATTLISSQPTGTGEHDYALLAITGSANGGTLPGVYPATPLAATAPHAGDKVYLGTYGSQDLSGVEIRSSLYPTLTQSTVLGRYTFNRDTVDVLEIGGSAASQEGSSGGAVVNDKGELIGIVTTSEITGSVDTRKLHTITIGYIRRDFSDLMGKDFDSYLSATSLTTLVSVFAPTAQQLGQYIAHIIGL